MSDLRTPMPDARDIPIRLGEWYDPDTGTPLIGRWPLDMALQHAREHDHGDAGYERGLTSLLITSLLIF